MKIRNVSRLTLLAGSALVATFASGCVINRTITDAVSHDSHNSYKVQTMSEYWGGQYTWEVWNCYKDDGKFTCSEVSHEGSKAGVKRPESGAAPASEDDAPAEEEAPAEEAPVNEDSDEEGDAS